ncbi:MAG: energy-coupling factor transporter transmembrane component T family protein [Candidatus Helarchaeota archaeon]
MDNLEFSTTQSNKSFFHKLDFRTKLFLTIVLSITCAFINDIRILIGLFGIIFIFIIISRNVIRLKTIILYILFFWFVITFLVYFFTQDLYYTINYFSKYFIRMYIVLFSGFLLSFTTAPNDMAKSLEKMKFPRSIIFTFTTALNNIPFFFNEFRLISESLKLRGVLSNGFSKIKNIKYIYRGYFIPIIIRIFKISDEKVASAEVKGFRSQRKRTSLKKIEMGKNDYSFIIFFILILVIALYIDKIYLPSDFFYYFTHIF